MWAGWRGLAIGVMRTEGEGPRGKGNSGRVSGGGGGVRRAVKWDLVMEGE